MVISSERVPGPDACAPDAMETLRVLVAEDDAMIALLLADMGREVCATVHHAGRQLFRFGIGSRRWGYNRASECP